MSLARKMFIPAGAVVPAIDLPDDVELGDVHVAAATLEEARAEVAAGRSPSLVWFVVSEAGLRARLDAFAALWADGITAWVFYPKRPHLGTDLSRDRTWAILAERGVRGTRQVGIDDRWSCLYLKRAAR